MKKKHSLTNKTFKVPKLAISTFNEWVFVLSSVARSRVT